MGKALIIAEATSCGSLQALLSAAGHEVWAADDLTLGWALATEHKTDVVALGTKTRGGDALALLPRIRQLPHCPEVVVISAVPDPKVAEFALRNGAWDFLVVKKEIEPVAAAMDQAIQYRREQKGEQTPVKLKREKIIGNSPGMKQCLRLLGQAAASDANVLIIGETGTGKELFARAIHSNRPRSKSLRVPMQNRNPRSEKNFVVVDCTALPETLVESVLFGHNRGAFTGADRNHDGLIAQADGGTLFLDEVGELPLEIQKAFLRVLQERSYRPVGSQVERQSNFRLVAATNRNLDRMVAEGRFRKDLLFRLRALTIELPPLRQRPEDIEDLIRHHTTRLCNSYDIEPKGFSNELLEALVSYSWPGNVRELINTIDGILASAGNDSIIYAKHLPLHVRLQIICTNMEPSGDTDPRPVSVHTLPKFKAYRESADIQYLEDLMNLAGRNIPKACELSGISRSRLYEMLAKYGINTVN